MVALAERRPRPPRHLPPRTAFLPRMTSDHTELLAASDALFKEGKPKIALAVIICIQDRMHAECTIGFARQFSCACEKPLGVNVKECIEVSEEFEKVRIVFALGHSK